MYVCGQPCYLKIDQQRIVPKQSLQNLFLMLPWAKKNYQILALYLEDSGIVKQDKFQQLISKRNSKAIFKILFSQNLFMQSIFQLILQSKKCMHLIDYWAITHGLQINSLIQQDINKSKKFFKIIKTVNKRIFQILDQEIEFSLSSNQFLHICLNKVIDQQDLLLILSRYSLEKKIILIKKYINLALTLKIDQKLIILLQKLYNFYFKKQIWTKCKFINHLNDFLFNPQLMTLQALKYNIIHQLVIKEDLNSIKELLLSSERQTLQNRTVFISLFNQYNVNNVTPISHALQYWPYHHLTILLSTVVKNHQEIMLDSECLLDLLKNKRLKQNELQQLLSEIISEQKDKGFKKLINRINLKNFKICLSNKYDVSDIYDIEQIKLVLNKVNGCAVINYINRYQQKSNLNIILKLQPNKFKKQSIKSIYKITRKSTSQKQYLNSLLQIFHYFQEFKMICLKYTLLYKQASSRNNQFTQFDDQFVSLGSLFSFLFQNTFMYKQFWPSYFSKNSVCYHLENFRIDQQLQKQLSKYVNQNIQKFQNFLFQVKYLSQNYHIVRKIQDKVKDKFLKSSSYLNANNLYRCLKAIKNNKQTCIINYHQFNNYMNQTYYYTSRYSKIFSLKWLFEVKYPFTNNIFFLLSRNIVFGEKTNLKQILSKHFVRQLKQDTKYFFYRYNDFNTQNQYEIVIQIILIMVTQKTELNAAIFFVNTQGKVKKYQQFICKLIQYCLRIQNEHQSKKKQEIQVILFQKLLESAFTPPNLFIKYIQNFLIIINIFRSKKIYSKDKKYQKLLIYNYHTLKNILKQSMRDPQKLKTINIQEHQINKRQQTQKLKINIRKMHILCQQQTLKQFSLEIIKAKLEKCQEQSQIQAIFAYLEQDKYQINCCKEGFKDIKFKYQKKKLINHSALNYFDFYLFYVSLFNQIEIEYLIKRQQKLYLLFYTIHLFRNQSKQKCIKFLRKSQINHQILNFIQRISYQLIIPFFHDDKYIIKTYFLNERTKNCKQVAFYILQYLLPNQQENWSLLLKIKKFYSAQLQAIFRKYNRISRINEKQNKKGVQEKQKKNRKNYLKVFQIIFGNKYCETLPQIYQSQNKILSYKQIKQIIQESQAIENLQCTKAQKSYLYWKRYSKKYIRNINCMMQNDDQLYLFLKIMRKLDKDLLLSQQIYQRCYSQKGQLNLFQFNKKLQKEGYQQYFIIQSCLFYIIVILIQNQQWGLIQHILQNNKIARKPLLTKMIFHISKSLQRSIEIKKICLADKFFKILMNFIFENCEEFEEFCEQNIYQNNIYSILLQLHPNGINKYIKYIQYSNKYKIPDPIFMLETINRLPQYANYFLNLPDLIKKQMIRYYQLQQQKIRMPNYWFMSLQDQSQINKNKIAYKYKRVKYSSTNKQIIKQKILNIHDYSVARLCIKIFTIISSNTPLHILMNILITQNWHIDLVRETLTPSQIHEVVTTLILQNPQKFDAKKWGIVNLFKQLTDQISNNRFSRYHLISFNFFKLMIENNCFYYINSQQNKLKYDTFQKIFRTHQKDKIQLYMKKYSIHFDQTLKRNLQIYCVDITQGITNLKQRKIIQIIKKYRLIDYFCDFLVSQKILLAICKQQMFQLLTFYIDSLKMIYTSIEYMASISQQCGLRYNILRLPLSASQYYGFYAYHYLIKSSFRQKLPLISTRSNIFKKFSFHLYSTTKIQYIRQLIVDQTKKYYQYQQFIIPQFQFIIGKKIAIFQQLFLNQRLGLTILYLIFKFLFEEQILSTNTKFNKIITSLINTVQIAINNYYPYHFGPFEMIYMLYINKKKHQIPQQVLQLRYSKQIRIVSQLFFVIGFNLWQYQYIDLSKQLFNNYLQLKEQMLIYNPSLFIEYFHEELCMSQAQFNQDQILLTLKHNQFKQFSHEVYQAIDMQKFHFQVEYFIGICSNLTFLSEKYSQIYSSYCYKLIKLLQFYQSTLNINRYNIMINMILLLFIIKAEFDQSKISNDLCVQHLLYLYQDKLHSISEILYYFINQINQPNTNTYLVHFLIEKLVVIQNIKIIKKDFKYQYLNVKDYGIKSDNIKLITDSCANSFLIPSQIMINNINETFVTLFNKQQIKVSAPLIQMIIAINLKIISNQLIVISNYLITTDSNKMRSQKLNIQKMSQFKQMIGVEKLQYFFIQKKSQNQTKASIEINHNLRLFISYEIVGDSERFYFINFCRESIEDLKKLISKLFIQNSIKKSQKYLLQKIVMKQDIFNNLLWTHSYRFDLQTLFNYPNYKIMNQMVKRNIIANKIIQIVESYDELYYEESNINHQSRSQHFKNNFNYYNIQDLFGPLSQIQEINQAELQHYLSFYRLIYLPQFQKDIIIKFIHQKQVKNFKNIYLQALQKYCKYVYNKYRQKYFQDKFQNTLYFIINNQNEIRIIMENCSSSILINIFKFIRSKQKMLITSVNMNYKFSINSIKIVLNKIQQYKMCKQSFKDLLDELINNNTIKLLNELIILNSNHIIFLSSVKYCVFNFIVNTQIKQSLYIISKVLSISHIQYEKSHSNLLINIYLNLRQHQKSQLSNQYFYPINRKVYLKKIATIEQITNQFIKKKNLQLYCCQISAQLSKYFQSPLNIYINYQQLYDFAKKKFQQHSIQQLQDLLRYLHDYITLKLKAEIQQYAKMPFIKKRYNNLTYCAFESIIMEKKQIQLQNKKQFDMQDLLQNLVLQAIPNIKFDKSQLLQKKRILNNSFLLHLKKESIKRLKTKAELLCKFKNKKIYSYLTVEKIDQYSKFPLDNIDYVILIAKQFPEDTSFSHRNILSIFYSDSYGQIYKIYQQKKILQSIKNGAFKSSISQARLLNMNICLYLQFMKQRQNKKNQETFIIDLKSLFQRRKITIQNIRGDRLSLSNKFINQQKNMSKLKQIQQFYFKTMGNKLNFKLFVQVDYVDQKIQKIVQISLQNMLSFFIYYLQKCFIDNQFKVLKSIEKQYCIYTQNIVEEKRKLFFTINIQAIQININRSQQYLVSYNQQLKILIISIGSQIDYFQLTYQFLRRILFVLLDISHLTHQCLRYQYHHNQLNNFDILCAIDYNLIFYNQIKELQMAVKIIKHAFNSSLVYSIGLVCNNQVTRSRYIQRQEKFSIIFNVSYEIRTVFSANYLVEIFLGSYYRNVFIQYNPSKRQIVCQNIYKKENQVKIYTFSQNRLIQQKLTIDQQALPRLIIPYNTKISGKKRFFIIFQKNNICASNYLFTINHDIKESILIDKIRNKLYPNKIYKFFLKQKQENKIEELKCFGTDLKFDKLVKIKKITKNVNVVQLQSSQCKTISFVIRDPLLSNMDNPQKTKMKIEFVQKQMQILNLKFIQFTKIKFDSKEVFVANSCAKKLSKLNGLEKYFQSDNLVSYSQFARFYAEKQSSNYHINEEHLKYTSRAGQRRIDFIRFKNQRESVLGINTQLKIQAIFVHVHTLRQIKASVLLSKFQIGLQWTPTWSGSYLLFINSWCVKKSHQIYIFAGPIQSFQAYPPGQLVLKYDQDYKIEFRIRDKFNNYYAEPQLNLFNKQIKDHILLVPALSQVKQYFNFRINKINQSGMLETLFRLSPNPYNQVEYYLKVKGQLFAILFYAYCGLNLQNRKGRLEKEIQRLKLNQQVLVVQRSNFLEDIVRIVQTIKFNISLKIVFKGEVGSDAGGLKRQFYDMVGQQMKKQQNQFFQIYNQKGGFFFHSKLLNRKKKESFMFIWGKYLANSITNGYLVGIKFAQPFIKLLYDEPISFTDLSQISSQKQIQNYESLFKYTDQELQSICLSFCQDLDGKIYQLKENGANIPVTKQNIQQYLNLKANYLIKIRHFSVVQAFRQGFNSIFDIRTVKKYIQSSEFWCLTIGQILITPQLLLNSITFTGHNIDLIISWFEKYINESKPQMLIGFLKFTTSSSCLEFNMAQKIHVQFDDEKQVNPLLGISIEVKVDERLPISHTCMKKIQIPRYSSYQILKQKLDYSFTECAEGFGIA